MSRSHTQEGPGQQQVLIMAGGRDVERPPGMGPEFIHTECGILRDLYFFGCVTLAMDCICDLRGGLK